MNFLITAKLTAAAITATDYSLMWEAIIVSGIRNLKKGVSFPNEIC